MTHHSRTLAHLHAEHLQAGGKPSDYLTYPWRKCLERYSQEKWALMKNPYRQKTPDPWLSQTQPTSWPQEHITQEQAEQWTINGNKHGNLSVILGQSNLASLDYDDPIPPAKLVTLGKKTLTMRTARGYQYFLQHNNQDYTENSDPDPLDQISQVYRDYSDEQDKPLLQVLRGIHYTLVPMSITCSRDHGARGHPRPDQKCVDGQNHDYRVREWLSLDKPVLTVDQAVKILL